MSIRRLIAFLICVGTPCVGHAQVFDNKAVVALHQAGLGEATIVTKINSLPCGYDVSTESLISLKKAGVSDVVIAAMVARCTGAARAQGLDNDSPDPLVKHAPGIYMAQDWTATKSLNLVRPAVGSGVRSTGNGSIVFPLKQLLQLPTAASRTRAPRPRPTFYFYFDADDRNVSDFGMDRSAAAQSPSEFNLIRFKIKNEAREVEVGRASQYFSVNVRDGINPKDSIAFSATEVGDGIFKVVPETDLSGGEYAFVFAGEKTRARVYDFAVDGPPAPEAAPPKK